MLAVQEAVTELSHALSLQPNDVEALRLRARCYRAQSNHEAEAIADFSKLIQNNAYTVEALCERGKLYAQTGADDKALQDFASAVKINPEEAEAYLGRGNVFYKQRKYLLAKDNYCAAIVNGTDKVSFCKVQFDVCRRLLNKNNAPASLKTVGADHDNRTK